MRASCRRSDLSFSPLTPVPGGRDDIFLSPSKPQLFFSVTRALPVKYPETGAKGARCWQCLKTALEPRILGPALLSVGNSKAQSQKTSPRNEVTSQKMVDLIVSTWKKNEFPLPPKESVHHLSNKPPPAHVLFLAGQSFLCAAQCAF